MMLMIIVILAVVGLCFGSFINALVWRLHEQEKEHSRKTVSKKYLKQLSISQGRSMCSHCKHPLGALDLIPLFSWLMLRGKCRYCGKPIADSPLVELALPVLFVLSYAYWPFDLSGNTLRFADTQFGLWLVLLVGLLALLVYDLRWLLLPNRIIYPLSFIAAAFAGVNLLHASRPLTALVNLLLAVLVGGGIFYLLFQISGGKWIGGGDVKLGWLLGLLAGTPARSVLFIFTAAMLGSLISVPLLLSKRMKGSSVIPFGPFLIIAAILVQLFGAAILLWYQKTFLPYTV